MLKQSNNVKHIRVFCKNKTIFFNCKVRKHLLYFLKKLKLQLLLYNMRKIVITGKTRRLVGAEKAPNAGYICENGDYFKA